MFKKGFIFVVFVSVLSCNNSLTTKEKENYSAKGKEIAQASFKELSNQLMKQMKEGGPSQAVPFCNTQALPITNKLSETYNVTIKRTSDKLRNPENKATPRELEVIEEYKSLRSAKKELAPIVEIDINNQKHFYAPIVLKANCIVCHGELNNHVSKKTDSILKELYPHDLAIGYKEGDLRGIWSITFKK